MAATILGVGLAVFEAQAQSQTQAAVHWTNNAGQDVLSALNGAGATFVTSFKETNDVSIQRVGSAINPIFLETFGGEYTYDNPWYVTSFVGGTTNGTGDGIAGDLIMLQTSADGANGSTLQFDFSVPLTRRDHILIADADAAKKFVIQAFVKSGATYAPVSLANWGFLSCAGHTKSYNHSFWPTWDAGTGTLESAFSLNFTEPLSVLTPDQNIDRLVVSKPAGSQNGSAYIQFVGEPRPTAQTTLTLQPAGTNLLVSWPQASSNLTLYTSTTLANDWVPVTNAAPVLVSGAWVVTNNLSELKRFYRLQWP